MAFCSPSTFGPSLPLRGSSWPCVTAPLKWSRPNLGTDLKCFSEAGSTHWENHELLGSLGRWNCLGTVWFFLPFFFPNTKNRYINIINYIIYIFWDIFWDGNIINQPDGDLGVKKWEDLSQNENAARVNDDKVWILGGETISRQTQIGDGHWLHG